jgi:hypothetical protein
VAAFAHRHAVRAGCGQPVAVAARILLGIGLAVLQQWSGINVIFNYAEEIYRGAGYGVSDILFNIVITGAINLVCSLVAMATVDRFGRRPLMLLGCAGVGTSHLLLGVAYSAGAKGQIYLRVDPSVKLEAVEAVLPLGLRRGRFKEPDTLITSLFEPG